MASAPPLVVDGVVYVSGEFWDEHTPRAGVVFALDASSGDELWRYDIPRGSWNELWADPVLANGMVYVGSFNGRMHALDALTGELRWSYMTGDVIRWPAVVVQDTVYFGSKDHYVYALDAFTGALHWRYETAGELWVGPVVADGLVYQGPGDPHLHIFEPSHRPYANPSLGHRDRIHRQWDGNVILRGQRRPAAQRPSTGQAR